MTDIKSGYSRRTVIKSAAWSVPVIATAVAMPLASASGDPVDPTDPNDVFDFYITASNVNGQGTTRGVVESNGVRTSPRGPIDDANPPFVLAGSTIQVTVTYDGDLDDFDFTDGPYGLGNNLELNGLWDDVQYSPRKLVFTYTTKSTSYEPTAPGIKWNLGPEAGDVLRPEDGSIKITGVMTVLPGGGFPDGGTLSPLVIDPNGGTGELVGPSQESWPPANY